MRDHDPLPDSATRPGPMRLGRYELLRIIGKGAWGLVYEGTDPVLLRRVAVKVVTVQAGTDLAECEARFRTEALAAARLLHPNIVPVFDFGRDGDIAYIVEQLVEGENLKDVIDRGAPFSPGQAVGLVLDVLAALDHAHENRVVHRDVKPSSIMVEDGRARLMNFGIAQIDAAEVVTTAGSVRYMSPEHVRGERVDRRTDLWAAGVVLYQLLCGATPFDGASVTKVLEKIVSRDLPAPPSEVRPGLPAPLDDVVLKALAKHRESRFQSAREFALALKEAAQGIKPLRAQPAAPAAPAAPLPPPGADKINLELELEFWKDIKESDEVGPFEDFLVQFPHGKFAHLARRRLAAMRGASVPGEPAVRVLHTGPSTDAARARAETVKDFEPEAAAKMGDESGPELPEGATVRDLLVRQHLNSGGFGIVYKAHDPGLDLEVALKEYLPRSLAHRDRAGQVKPFRDANSQALFRKGLDSFLLEGRLLARVDHPALAKVHQAFQANGTGYIVMKLYRGLTLKEALRRDGALATEEWLRMLLARVGGALQTLHGENIYHRDIAPDNIILHDGRDPVVLDFGAARQVLAQVDHTLTAIYKPGYAPVEQYGDDDSLRQGAWTDVYALCATVHFAIHGRPPLAAPMRMRQDPQVPLAHTAADRFSKDFLAAIDRGLSVMPDERPRTIAELLREAGI